MASNDVLHLIDLLYEMVDEAKNAPLSSDRCMISRNEVLDMLGELRAQLPVELKKAQDLIRARDEYVAAAKREAERIRQDAELEAKTIVSESRIDLVENKVVLAVPDDNPAGIESFTDLSTDKLSLLCLGNDDVPVGAYSLQILEYLGIDIAGLESDGKVTYASNVSEVANQVKEGAVDCGIIYATDAFTYELNVVDQAAPEMCDQVIYPAAVMKSGTEGAAEAAQAFLDYIHTDADAVAILEGVGFTVL